MQKSSPRLGMCARGVRRTIHAASAALPVAVRGATTSSNVSLREWRRVTQGEAAGTQPPGTENVTWREPPNTNEFVDRAGNN